MNKFLIVAVATLFLASAPVLADDATSEVYVEYSEGIDLSGYGLLLTDEAQTSVGFKQDHGLVHFEMEAVSGNDSVDLTAGVEFDHAGFRWLFETKYFTQLLDEDSVGEIKARISQRHDIDDNSTLGWNTEARFLSLDDLSSVSVGGEYRHEFGRATAVLRAGIGADPSDFDDSFELYTARMQYEISEDIELRVEYTSTGGDEALTARLTLMTF